MTSAVVDSGGSVLELSSNGVENQEGGDNVPEYPAVIVEPVPSARLEQGYAAQVLVYDDETYMMQDVAEEQEVETENSETEGTFADFASAEREVRLFLPRPASPRAGGLRLPSLRCPCGR